MCQVGSFGMAVRGHDYREILEHYYTGVEIVRAR
jgi:SpoIID/LytB domain protein